MIETIQRERLRTRPLGTWAVPMAHPEIEGVASGVPVRCPKCGHASTGCARMQWEDLVRRIMGSHPWKCPACFLRFYLKRRSQPDSAG